MARLKRRKIKIKDKQIEKENIQQRNSKIK